jgi:hypothetical protein
VEEDPVEGVAFLAKQTGFHRYAADSKLFQPLPRDQGIRVVRAYHDAGNARRENGLGTRRLASMVAAGFQSDVHRGPRRRFAAVRESVPFGVQVPAAAVIALPDDASVFDDYRAYHGVGTGPAEPLFGQGEGQTHIVDIVHVSPPKEKALNTSVQGLMPKESARTAYKKL